MASGAGGLIGAAIGGPVGAVIGALVGAVIDQAILIPMLTDDSDEPPGIGTFKINYADEGAGAPYCYGQNNRVAGQIVFASLPTFEDSGGGGKRKEPVSRTHYTDVVYALAWNQVEEHSELRTNGALLYDGDPNSTTGNLLLSLNQEVNVFFDSTNSTQLWRLVFPGTLQWSLRHWYCVIEPISTSLPTLAQFTPGARVTVGMVGQAVPFQSFEAIVVDSGISRFVGTRPVQRLVLDLEPFWGATSEFSVYKLTATTTAINPPELSDNDWAPGGGWWPALAAQAQIASIVVDQLGVSWRVDAVNETESNAQILGVSGRQESTVMQKHLGQSIPPGWPGISRVDLAELNISQTGSQLPQVQAFVNESGTSARFVTEMISTLLVAHAGLQSFQVDTSNFTTADEMFGYTFQGSQTVARVLAPLLIGYEIYVSEHQDRLRFYDRDSRPRVSVDPAHLDARPFGDPPGPPITLGDLNERQQPKRIHLRYRDIGKQMQFGDVYDQIDVVNGGAESVMQITLPMAFDQPTAFKIARRMLRESQESRRPCTLRLPAWYMDVTEVDVLVMDFNSSPTGELLEGQPWYVQIERIDIGDDLLIEIEGKASNDPPPDLAQLSSLVISSAGTITPAINDQTHAQPTIQTIAMELPALIDAHAREPGVYVANARVGETAIGGDESLLRELGSGTGSAWAAMTRELRYVTMGYLRRPLPSGNPDVFDYNHTIHVELVTPEGARNEPSSSTEAVVLDANTNLMAIEGPEGWELAQFVTATGVADEEDGSTRRFELTGLRRGLSGTDDRMEHGRGATVVFFKREDLQFLPMDLSLAGTEQTLRGVPRGTVPTSTDAAHQFTYTGDSALSLPPAQLTATRTADGILIEWERRSRIGFRNLGGVEPPLAETIESYDVIVDPDTTNRVQLVSGATEWTYPTARIADDGLTTTQELVIRVAQRDAVRGRGRYAEITLPQEAGVIQLEDGSGNILLEHADNFATES